MDAEHSIPMPADDKEMWKHLKRLNDIVFCIEFLEYSSNAIGTVAFLGATVVLLGGFRSVLSPVDFWFAAVMIFMEGTRVFIGKDTSVNQWLFGSTRAFRWDHFSFSGIHGYWNLFALIIGGSISLVPLEFGSQIITGILKVAILVISSQLLTRTHRGPFVIAVLTLFALVGVGGSLYWFSDKVHKFGYKRAYKLANPNFTGKSIGVIIGTSLGVSVLGQVMKCMAPRDGKSIRVLWLVILATGLAYLPLLQEKLGRPNSPYRYLRLLIAAAILIANLPNAPPEEEQSSNALLLGTWQLLLKILDTIMPILFFWGVMFPLPGISLKLSSYMLLSVIAAVLVGNLQIPVASLQILLSALRLHSLLAGREYHPLPEGASPNMVPSIVVFYVLELCQGLSNILGIIIGLVSFWYRKKLVHVLGLKGQEWGAKAVNLYYHQACMTIKEKGLFPMEKSTLPSLDSFAIESLGCTSSEMQIVRLHVLDYYLRQQADSKYRRKLIAQIDKDATGFLTKIAEIISHLITDEEINSGNKKIRSYLSLSVKFVKLLAVTGGKIGTRFRQEMKGNPILLHSLHRILDLKECKQELWEPTMDVIKLLALDNEATGKEVVSTHADAAIPKLLCLFLSTGEVNLKDNKDGHSVRKAAAEVLENLTITSSDNCRTILEMEAGPRRLDLIKNLISMLNKDDEYLSVAANLLHNLYANSGDMQINLDNNAKEGLKSSMRRVMQIIIGNENDELQSENSGIKVVEQLDAALRVMSKIGYVIPREDFAHMLAENLAPNTNAAAEKLVGKLVDTLKSNREPNREFPRLRRVLIETVILIVEACHEYKEIFREKGAEEALNMLIGTSSRLEKYKVFVEGEGMVPESPPMQEVVDKAKKLFMVDEANPANQGL